MAKRYPPSFRRSVCERLLAGENVTALATELGVSTATLYLWRKQAEIDAGVRSGRRSLEVDELAQAYKRIAELEHELDITRAAVAIFNEEEPVSPKGGARLSQH
jgi:transposase-like protein